jgi:hypothetical protein
VPPSVKVLSGGVDSNVLQRAKPRTKRRDHGAALCNEKLPEPAVPDLRRLGHEVLTMASSAARLRRLTNTAGRQ